MSFGSFKFDADGFFNLKNLKSRIFAFNVECLESVTRIFAFNVEFLESVTRIFAFNVEFLEPVTRILRPMSYGTEEDRKSNV